VGKNNIANFKQMKTLKTTIIYLVSNIIEKGMAFLLIPLYTHYLLPKDYGILSILQSLIAIFIIFFTFSLNGAASRFHFDGKELYRKFHYGNIFLSITVISFIFSIIFYFFKDYIFSAIGNIPIYPYFYLVIIIAYGSTIFNLYKLKLQMEQKALEYGINSIIKFIISSGIAILLLIVFHKKVDGVLEGMAITISLFCLYIFFKLWKDKIKFNFNKNIFNKNIRYSIYLIPHNLASVLMAFLDKFFIINMISLAEAGVYTLGNQISSILGIFAMSINTAMVAPTLRAFKERDYKYLTELANISVISISIIAVFLSLFSSNIISLISSKSYYTAHIVIPILSFYFVVQMYYYRIVGVLFYDTKATKFVPIATGLSLILNFSLNYFFIKFWGIIGAAIATLVSIIVVNYIVIFIANRYIKVGFEHFKIHFIIIFSFAVANISFFIDINLLIKLLLFILVCLVLLYCKRNNSLLFFIFHKVRRVANKGKI